MHFDIKSQKFLDYDQFLNKYAYILKNWLQIKNGTFRLINHIT